MTNQEQHPKATRLLLLNQEQYLRATRFPLPNQEQYLRATRFPLPSQEQYLRATRFQFPNQEQHPRVSGLPVSNHEQQPRALGFPDNNLEQHPSVPGLPLTNQKQYSRCPVYNHEQPPRVSGFTVNNHKQPQRAAGLPVNNHEQPPRVPGLPVNNHEQPPRAPGPPVNNLGQHPKVPGLPVNNHEQPPRVPGFPVSNHEQHPRAPGLPLNNHEQHPKVPGLPVNNHEQPARVPGLPVNNHEQHPKAPGLPVNNHEQHPKAPGPPVNNHELHTRAPGLPMTNPLPSSSPKVSSPHDRHNGKSVNNLAIKPKRKTVRMSQSDSSRNGTVTPEHRPDGPEHRPEEAKNRPKEPECQSEGPEHRPKESERQLRGSEHSLEPERQPEEPEHCPEKPERQPEGPELRPEELERQPEGPELRPEEPEEITLSFWCDFCGRSFRKKFGLAKHMLNHMTDKPHQCDMCNKTFTYRSPWIYHMKTRHDYLLFDPKLNGMKLYNDVTSQQTHHSNEDINNLQNDYNNQDVNNQQNDYNNRDINNQQDCSTKHDVNNQQNIYGNNNINSHQNNYHNYDTDNQQNSSTNHDANNQQNGHNDQDINNQQNGHNNQDINNQQKGLGKQNVSNKQNDHSKQTLNNQQNDHSKQALNNQQNDHSKQALNNKQNDHSKQTLNNQQNDHSKQTLNNQQNDHSKQALNNKLNVHRQQGLNNQQNDHSKQTLNNQQNDHSKQTLNNQLNEYSKQTLNNQQNDHSKQTLNNQQNDHSKQTLNNQQNDHSKQALNNQQNNHSLLKQDVNNQQIGNINFANYQQMRSILFPTVGNLLSSHRAIRNSFMEPLRYKGFPFKMTSVKRFGEYLRPCAKCQTCFKTERNLASHEMITHRKRKKNSHAQYKRKLVESGNRHVVKSERICSNFDRPIQRRKRYHQCFKCGNLFRLLRTHQSEKQECASCGESFSVKENGRCGTTKDIKRHENRIDPKKPTKNIQGTRSVTTGSHQSDQCNETFNLEPELNVHVEKTHRVRTDGESDGKLQTIKESVLDAKYNSEQGKLECEMCDKSFQFKFQLNDHRRAAHNVKTILHCARCGKKFINVHNYVNHVIAHVVRGRPAKPDMTTHGTPEGTNVPGDGVTRAPSANGSHRNGFTMGDDQHDNAVQSFPTSPGMSGQPISSGESATSDLPATSDADPHSDAQDVYPVGKRSYEQKPDDSHTTGAVTMATNPPQPRDHVSPATPKVTIEYLQQEKVMTESETVTRVEEAEFNRKHRDTGSDVILQHTSPRQQSNNIASSPAQGQGETSGKRFGTNEMSYFECGLCHQEFTEEIALTAHREILHSIQCTRCGKAIPDSSSFVQHAINDCENRVVVHIGPKNKSQPSTKDHATKNHHDENRFQCTLWGEEFRTESPLTEQMKKCNTGKRHRCTECDETFITKWAFALHKQHEGQIVYGQCETSDGIPHSQCETSDGIPHSQCETSDGIPHSQCETSEMEYPTVSVKLVMEYPTVNGG